MYKKCSVLLLPTNNKTNISLLTEGKLVLNQPIGVCQHLYILYGDSIKEGEWCYQTVTKKIIQCPFDCIGDDRYQKVIATTDRLVTYVTYHSDNDMLITSIPQLFIDKYVDEYNKGNQIEEIMVEYIKVCNGNHLKLNPDNTINISLKKDSWTRDEVINIIAEFNVNFGASMSNEKRIKWINDNL